MTTEMALENILTEIKNEVLVITINRPDKLNALIYTYRNKKRSISNYY